MAEITAALVKALREKTGAGMMDAKKALVENNGDEAAAVDWLRAKGLSKAAKKSGRTAADGLVSVQVSEDGKTGAIVELNAETDFVARNEKFQTALAGITKVALDTDGSVEALSSAGSPDGEGTVDDLIKRLIATIGENMTLRRSAKLTADGKVASYIPTPKLRAWVKWAFWLLWTDQVIWKTSVARLRCTLLPHRLPLQRPMSWIRQSLKPRSVF